MNRFGAILAVGILCLGLTAPQAAARRSDECRYQTLERGKWTPRENTLTIACFARKYDISTTTALRIARAESGLNELAINYTGCNGYRCYGLYQHHGLYWRSRVSSFSKALKRFHVERPAWRNPRAQAVVTLRMVQNNGWGAWSTY